MAGDGRITFTPSPQIALYLRRLRKKGFYGKKTGDVINQIINNGITQLLKDGLLEKLPAELEGSEEEDDGAG